MYRCMNESTDGKAYGRKVGKMDRQRDRQTHTQTDRQNDDWMGVDGKTVIVRYESDLSNRKENKKMGKLGKDMRKRN